MPDRLVLAAPCAAELVERKSRFLARLEPVRDAQAADAVIHAARRAAPSARHHCSAMVIKSDPSPITRSNDDGEPAGTAGMPMLLQLQGAGLVDVVAVVTRYFGGIKLGTGRLARAYGDAVAAAIGTARLLRRIELTVISARADHAEAGAAEHWLRHVAATHGGMVEAPTFDATGVQLTMLVPPQDTESALNALAGATAGRISTAVEGTRLADLPLE